MDKQVLIINHSVYLSLSRTTGHAVAQFVEVLRYKLGSRRFDPRWGR